MRLPSPKVNWCPVLGSSNARDDAPCTACSLLMAQWPRGGLSRQHGTAGPCRRPRFDWASDLGIISQVPSSRGHLTLSFQTQILDRPWKNSVFVRNTFTRPRSPKEGVTKITIRFPVSLQIETFWSLNFYRYTLNGSIYLINVISLSLFFFLIHIFSKQQHSKEIFENFV